MAPISDHTGIHQKIHKIQHKFLPVSRFIPYNPSGITKKMKTSFWTYFTSAYGMIWLVMLGCSVITSSRIDAGAFGLIGFPVLSAIYAWIRWARDRDEDLWHKRTRRARNYEDKTQQGDSVLPPRLGEFLRAHPEFSRTPRRVRDASFHNWLNHPDNR